MAVSHEVLHRRNNPAAGERPAEGFRSLVEAFRATAARAPDQVAVVGETESISWAPLGCWVDDVAKGFADMGVGHGDVVALLLGNRPEFHVADLAAMTLGATTFSVYATSPADQVAHMLNDSGARVLVTESRFLGVVRSALRGVVGHAPAVVVVDADGVEALGMVSLAAVERRGSLAGTDLDTAAAAIDGDTPLVLIYTSGTTGPPKCVELTHRSALVAVEATRARIPFGADARVISWLPAAHVAERLAHHYLPVVLGLIVVCCPDPRQIGTCLVDTQPTWFFGVPRVWEKIKAAAEADVARSGIPGADRAREAIALGRRKVELEQAGMPVPEELREAVAEVDTEVLGPLRERLGLGALAAANVGAAPIPTEVLYFFHAIGVPLAEVYGLSESFAVGTSNPVERIKIGTVGLPPVGVEIWIADDGEIMMRTDAMMAGYRNAPEESAAVLREGWLATGDLGALDDDGYLTVVDRKKEIIISSAGKNMSPSRIEAELKSATPLIGQACCIGDGRPYNTALLVLDSEYARSWAAERGFEQMSVADLVVDARLRAAINDGVARANTRLSRPEQIKRCHLSAAEWLAGGDELMPTAKLRRRRIDEIHQSVIDAMYAEASDPAVSVPIREESGTS